ncbi:MULTISPECIES: RNA polymerase factor sigma-54 [Psychrilyobacter]|uniref:RNA polymerase sigma-54 factor n=1 Tax=Psychrilyobacter piezotolerans TaxID=2293438 RepID=A0ABX9KFX8_9FUSO|nr:MULTISPECIES: hypothetical protein [Psychrilyobacter]MCS5422111.1 hypothetical protein [Psychrilyobacter sp. S5]NDI78399.1 hypothetical protein [Psychrilyobacter piezotolerans]RDE61125.1 hypothetical protein DV867_09795 [Psychrilyobacter sp. S5]REI40766.1 hypothetical protein DYH56_09795 [Psychrilyobacter piezotolerans]
MDILLGTKQVLSQKNIKKLKILEMNTDELNSFLWEFKSENFIPTTELTNEIYEKKEDSLEEFLWDQLRFLKIGRLEKEICRYFAESLDDKGYLNISLNAAARKFKTTIFKVKEAKETLETLEPAGIGAGNLKEAIIIQSRNHEELKKISPKIWDDILNMRLDRAAIKLGISVTALKDLIAPVRNFISYPRRDFASKKARIQSSDIMISNELILTLDKRYEYQFDGGELSQFLSRKKLKEIDSINLALEARRKTLLNIAHFILEKQRKFFCGGYMVPLKLSDVAGELELHISTISRACKDKILEYNCKQYKLNDFFVGEAGKGCSSQRLSVEIQKLVDAEDKFNPYSDEEIRKRLEEKDTVVARRTVTKYRERLGILKGRLRKNYE